MTTQYDLEPEGKFVRAVLPWIVAAAALVLYLSTLSHWMTFGSIPYVARATGQSWYPELTGSYYNLGPNSPLLYLVSYPIRWLPQGWVPLALNLFSTACAILTLALLVRSVALLPHDRTHDQREREYYGITLASLRLAWIPPLLAAFVCGLQLAFWENATAMAGDMFELLLFAYIVRCLLEYRSTERDSWLFRATVIYGAAMTGNWFIVALLPWFIVSVLWIRGVSFFNLRFLGMMLLCGLAGLLLYLLFPLIYVLSGKTAVSFWYALKINIVAQKNLIMNLSMAFRGNNDLLVRLMLASLTSFLPILLIGIRWASHFGDPSPLGTTLTRIVFHLAHATLLGACVWVAFDPSFSPRHIGFPFPQLNYLSALSVGYLSGYFLLVFIPIQKRMHPEAVVMPLFNRAAQTVICLLLLLVPAGLIFKNLPLVRLTNGPAVQQYASLLAQNLPTSAVVLGDDATKLYLTSTWLAREGKAKDYIFLDTQSLPSPEYHQYLEERYPKVWKAPPDQKKGTAIPDTYLQNYLVQLSEKVPVYYLHPSFGFYFEKFYSVPHGLVHQLVRYPTNLLVRPPLPDAVIAGNESFWKELSRMTDPLIPYITQPPQGKSTDLRALLMEKMHIPYEPSITARILGIFYSHSLNVWGIQMQEIGRLKEASEHFTDAQTLNPNNTAAKANLELNRTLQAGQRCVVSTVTSITDEFKKQGNPEQLIRINGPFDDPTHRFILAHLFAENGNLRQSAHQFERVLELAPDYVPAEYAYARLLIYLRLPEKALDLVEKIRARPDALNETGIKRLDLLQVQALALLTDNRPLEAEHLMQNAMNQNPEDDDLLSAVFQISSAFGRHTNALSAVERQLQREPDNTVALVNEGYLRLQLGQFAQAIPPLTRALTIETNNHTARLDRAIAYLQSSQLDDAQQDYEILRKSYPNEFRIFYGLGEIAWQKKDTNAAVRNYERFLANSDPNTEDAKVIKERLKGLKGEPPEDAPPNP